VAEPHRGRVVAASQLEKENTMSKQPMFIAYSVKERGRGRKPIWVRIGGAWPFESGTPGYTIQLDALPIDGRIVLAGLKVEDETSEAVPEIANG
jgi:hypothetical protein